jgi:hypothetical protein
MATRIIRWVGHPSPLDDKNIRRGIERQSLHPEVVLAFQRFEHNRRVSVRRGSGTFAVGPQHGFSREYKWGPVYFDVEMEERDWARLWSNPFDRHMFMDVTQGVPPFRPLLTQAQWRELITAMDKYPGPQTMIAL